MLLALVLIKDVASIDSSHVEGGKVVRRRETNKGSVRNPFNRCGKERLLATLLKNRDVPDFSFEDETSSLLLNVKVDMHCNCAKSASSGNLVKNFAGARFGHICCR